MYSDFSNGEKKNEKINTFIRCKISVKIKRNNFVYLKLCKTEKDIKACWKYSSDRKINMSFVKGYSKKSRIVNVLPYQELRSP